MCDIDGGDGPDFYARSTVKARKRHACDSCGGPIAPGEKYAREVVIGERGAKPEAFKVCVPCDAISDAFMHAHDSGPLAPYLRSALKRCIDEEPETAPEWQPMLDAMALRKAAA